MDNPLFKGDLHIPRTKPFSNDTWEIGTNLDSGVEVSEREPMIFPAPCRIVGLYPSIIPNDSSGLVVPTVDDIMVLLDFNQQRRYTANVGQSTQALRGSGFVTLGAMNTLIRDLDIVVDNPRPQAGFQFRWKRYIQGTPIYRSVVVSCALFVEINDGGY